MPANPRHGRRIFALWLVLAAVATPVVVLVAGPHLPPQDATVQAQHQQQINTILAGIVTPIVLAILVYIAYSLVTWRSRQLEPGSDGVLLRGNRRLVIWWIVANVIVVSFVVAYGTYDWIGPGVGSGSAQGPSPIARPTGETPLEVQVIAQQWQFTFRYPSYGAIETPELMIPEGRYVEFHVTSLDVIHSFWAVSLGVKADAVAGADNVVYVRADEPGSFRVQCSELCGLYHGQMYQVTAKVLAGPDFDLWIAQQQKTYGAIVPYLPPYAHVYYPDPQNLAG
jgi:cytochrome c oxidase subunit 2